MLKIKGLIKTYPTGDKALRGVDLTVEKGEILALIGPSGAGKSTLIRCVNRLVEPTAGTVFLDDLDITGLSMRNLRRARRKIGMIFQEYALVERLTVMENVLSGKLGYMSLFQTLLRRYPGNFVEEALELIERVGLESQYEKRADALSGGQRQRVGIARALMQNPDILLIDEPTASLDPRTSRTILRLIQELCRERNLPAILNIHDISLAKLFSDRIVGLSQGNVVFEGSPSQLDSHVLTTIYGEEDWNAEASKEKGESASSLPGMSCLEAECE